MQELESRELALQFGPEPPNPEAAITNVSVVKQDDAPVGHLALPGLVVMPHILIGVPAIDVQQVN